MITEHPVYHGILELIAIKLGHLAKPLQKRIVRYILGMFMAQSVVQREVASRLACLTPNKTTQDSHERTLRRALSDHRLSWRNVYLPFLRKMLPLQEVENVVLVVDETARNEHFRVLVATLYCAGRAVPIAWESWRAQKKKTIRYWTHLQRLLQKVSKVLKKDVRVLVIGDRAFGNTQFSDVVESYGWDWLARLQKQTCFEFRQGFDKQVQTLINKPGYYKARGRLFKKAGWRNATLECYWEDGHKEALFLGSSLPKSANLVELYRKRFSIECMFRDWKSKGFQWESSQLQNYHRHQRLILLMAMSTVLALCLGNETVKEMLAKPTRGVKTRPVEAKSSLFQMGLQRMNSCLYQTLKLPKEWSLPRLDQPSWIEQICQHHVDPVAVARNENAA